MQSKLWTREESLAAFGLYCHLPFGKLHRHNPDIIAFARSVGRTPSAVAMKLVNFASLDPIQQQRNIRGLSNVSRSDRELWLEFASNAEKIAFECQQAYEDLITGDNKLASTFIASAEKSLPNATDALRMVRVRLVQSFFRDAVLTSYDYKCAICQIDLVELLTASHIIPWSHNVERRADPRNGLSLCAIHDRAFDRGLLTIDTNFKIVLSAKAKQPTVNPMCLFALQGIEGEMITLPKRFPPDPAALEYHRDKVFQ